jgi:hypothetical protein
MARQSREVERSFGPAIRAQQRRGPGWYVFRTRYPDGEWTDWDVAKFRSSPSEQPKGGSMPSQLDRIEQKLDQVLGLLRKE